MSMVQLSQLSKSATHSWKEMSLGDVPNSVHDMCSLRATRNLYITAASYLFLPSKLLGVVSDGKREPSLQPGF